MKDRAKTEFSFYGYVTRVISYEIKMGGRYYSKVRIMTADGKAMYAYTLGTKGADIPRTMCKFTTEPLGLVKSGEERLTGFLITGYKALKKFE